ncbi:YegS/Rv2252/BmrU family lipid kinase [Pseudoalteromonas sp. OOF1S-7]|uniref:diacylglycerol/lipid kinase family protein n=1 Tax=Pseudoalteromonas sp. OOF1S-7 TaxID=2917757 RepID=UPI001EF6256E|nr:YegS/Rv2252/BmrU family lipid kinase [Pseudoalteromonas sp. OOF1S-7]MCG7537457.1 YegS/Rv2252/BmrU family lipid kinase [Pseudoalteromonas sp. OOF1S-7]
MLVIYKPGGGRRLQRHLRWLRAQAKQRRITISWYETTGFYGRDQDAIRLQTHGQSLIVVVGGDGTINLVVNAMCGSSAQLACLPAGTGNDFCRQFSYTDQQWRAAVFSSNSIALDAGAVGARYFVNIAGVGFNAEVVQSLQGQKRAGALSYVWGGIKQLFCAPTVELKTAQNRGLKQGMMLLLANGRFFAAGLQPAPLASLQDGQLECMWFSAQSWWQRLVVFAAMLVGCHQRLPWVHREKRTQLDIITPGLAVEADGDLVATTPVTIRSLPGAIQLRVLPETALPD